MPGEPTAADQLHAAVSWDGYTCIVTVRGEIDVRSAGQLCQVLVEQLPREPGQLVVDLSEVEQCTEAGVRALLDVRAQAPASMTLRVVAAGTPIRQALRIADAGQELEVYSSVEQAVSEPQVTEQATGMLMQVLGVGADEAFQQLVRISEETDTPVRTVAEQIVQELTGTVSVPAAAATVDDQESAAPPAGGLTGGT